MGQEQMDAGVRSRGRLRAWGLPNRFIPMLFLASLVIALCAGPFIISELTKSPGTEPGHIFGSLILGYMFAGVPILVCLTQNGSQRRQLDTLNMYSETAMGRTRYFRQAMLSVQSSNPAALTADYVLPIMVLFWIAVFGITTIFLSALMNFHDPSIVLSGVHISWLNPEIVELYQKQTFAVGAAAFFGAYIYVTQRLIERTVASDLYPAVFYKYSAHILIACSVAGIFRLGIPLEQFETNATAGLTIIGFIIGRYPNLVIGSLARSIASRLTFLAYRPEIRGNLVPATLSLQLLDDIQPEMIDRLAELQIFSAFDLATRNPILIWLKIPNELGQIVAWIAQAQLLTLVREVGLGKVRLLMVRDIFDFVLRLGDPIGNAYLVEQLDLKGGESAILVQTIEASDQYVSLFELREALKA